MENRMANAKEKEWEEKRKEIDAVNIEDASKVFDDEKEEPKEDTKNKQEGKHPMEGRMINAKEKELEEKKKEIENTLIVRHELLNKK